MGKSARKGTLEKLKKAPAKKPVAKQPVAKKPPVKLAPSTKPSAKTSAPAPAKNQALAKPMAATASAPVAKTTATKKSAKPAKALEAAPPDSTVKRPAKLFFIEVKPGAERVIKRGDKSLAAPAPVDVQARRKDAATEETAEELVERIERELQHQSFFKRNTLKPQMCTKCGINAVAERFTIDRELGYCNSCAEILRLGATKEARRMEFNPSMKKEGEGAAAEGEGEAAPIAEPEASEVEEESVPDID